MSDVLKNRSKKQFLQIAATQFHFKVSMTDFMKALDKMLVNDVFNLQVSCPR